MIRSSRTRAVAVVAVAAVAYLAWVAAVVGRLIFMQATGRFDAEEFINTVVWSMAFLGLPAVGAILAVRRPANPIGWTILSFATGVYLLLATGSYVDVTVARGGVLDGTGLHVAAVVNAVSPGLIVVFVHLLLFFPNGEMTGWARRLSRVSVGIFVFLAPLRLFRPGRLDMTVDVMNPLAVPAMADVVSAVGPLTVALLLTGALAFARLVARFRRADASERAQFRWILLALGAWPLLLGVGIAMELLWLDRFLVTLVIVTGFNVGLLGFAYALYRAITRHDLFGIGRVVSRSLTYAVLTAVLVGVYLGLVVGLGSLARAVTGDSGDLVVALSTLAVAALFHPVRRRVRASVDQRFNRGRYDAARTVDAFGRRLRDEVSLPAIVEGLRSTTASTFQPLSVGVVLASTAPTDRSQP